MSVSDRTAPKIRTRGQAEEIAYKLMKAGAVVAGVGLLLCMTVILAWLGVPLLIAGIVIVLGDIAWMALLMRQPTEEVECRQCHNRNVVFASVDEFHCDDCHQQIERRTGRPTVGTQVPV
jgi:hypothetical protein